MLSLPMWHPMTWDYVGGALTAALIVGALARWRAGFLRRERARLEALVAERTRELRASEMKFRGIFEDAVEGIFQSSLDGRNLAANPAMAQLCGYASPEALRAAVTDIASQFYVQPGRREEINARLAAEGDALVGVESEIRRRDGSTLWVSENVRRVHDAASGQSLYLGSIVDATAKRAVEAELRAARDAAEAASRAKGAFLANMSHELRTPLNAILGFVRVMRRDPVTETRFHERLAIVANSGEQLLQLINEVLDLSKIEAGKMELRPGPCSLPGLLLALTDVFGPRAAETGVAFACVMDPKTVPTLVRADEGRLRQVLTNLLDNAFKFTSQGGRVELRVATTATAANGPTLEFAVQDTGVGIDADRQEEIFQPFHQLDDGRRGAQEGTGLGLSISRRLVELMGGELRLESAPGRGSTFSFTLNLPPSAPPAGAGNSRARPPITGYRGARQRVLVVDDEAVNRALVRELLAPTGLEVSEAAGGQDCLERVAELRPDLILLDLRMAPPDGFETAERLRLADPTREVKILASSAGVLTSPEQARLAATCDGFLPKPLDVDALLDGVADLLGLEWTCEAEKTEANPPAVPPTPPELPPREEIETLLTLARHGDVVRLRARLRESRPPAGAPAGFLQQIETMAASFQLGRITRTLQDALTRLDRPR